jgi:mannose-1-phosphate guanylyltransferase
MHGVILAGGVGSRLWPASNKLSPKSLIKFESEYSLLQLTLLRTSKIKKLKTIIIVASKIHIEQIISHCEEIKPYLLNIAIHIIAEPHSKDTAAAIMAASLYISNKYGSKDKLLVMPSDHLIEQETEFYKDISRGKWLANKEKLILFGIKPSHADHNYGYIEYDKGKIKKFTEKPNKTLAKQYTESGKYLWNTGMICARADILLQEGHNYCSDMVEQVKKALNKAVIQHNIINSNYIEIILDEASFCSIIKISVDYAILQKSCNLELVTANFRYRDMGNWHIVHDDNLSDHNGNQTKGNVVTYRSSNCYIESNNKLIAAIGLENLAIIEHENGILVINKNESDAIKYVYASLKKY